ncbi:efflux RND transporter periplasmic adaptor subunit [Ruegeria arenilitoris]|uniref:efflux RND transporter periplasmic adaptor subunit n=1 Tax=Ruegeria arenilitoris TaxID=1173585 RepID=UPI001480C0B9|nr:efflux RND transporter periplasmic adaptor subunit [Ruegeria arenilitoris]MBY6082746.1 efflux RND transporter periplasmic adaptor subunit [Ruegeria arenilitoris]
MHIKSLSLFSALVFFAQGSVLEAQESTGSARPAKVYTVVETDTLYQRSYPAIVYPSQEVELSFRVSGRIVELPIRASMSIAQGDVVAKLDTRDFEAEVRRLESQMDQAKAQLIVLRVGARPEEIAALEAAVAAAQAQLDQARDDFERTQRLVERGVAPASQFEQRLAAYRVAQAELRSQQEQLAIGRSGGRPEEILAAEAQLRGLEAQVQSARDNLSDTTLRAPFSGTISSRFVENFRNVQAGEAIALLQNLSTVEVGFDLPGADIIAMSGLDIENVTSVVIFESMPDVEVPAELVEFTTQADAATQTYRGRLSVTPPDGMIVLPGMVARVISRANRQQAPQMTVPLSALASSPDGSTFVWRVDTSDNTVSRQPVELGDVSEGGVVINTGLEAGAVVVTAGLSGLQEGMAIRPISKIGD